MKKLKATNDKPSKKLIKNLMVFLVGKFKKSLQANLLSPPVFILAKTHLKAKAIAIISHFEQNDPSIQRILLALQKFRPHSKL